MNFGIIGYGRMGKLYHETLCAMNINVSFLCDVQKSDTSIKFYQDYKEALNSSDIDGIIISTTAPSHYEIIKYALDKEIKYIVCEKPFTVSIKQADDIIHRLQSSKSRLAVNYSRRFSENYCKLRDELHQKNIIGKPRLMLFTCGAGGLSAVGTHFFDLCSFLLNSKAKSVYAVPIDKKIPNPRGSQFEDPGGYILLNLENEMRAYIDMGDDLGVQPIIEIVGEYGRVIIDDVEDTILIKKRTKEDMKEPKYKYGISNPIAENHQFRMGTLKDLIIKMIKNLITELPLISTAEMAKNEVEIYSAIRKSFVTKETVFLPLTDEYYEKEFNVT